MAFFRAWLCLVAWLSRRVAGFHGPWWFPSWWQGQRLTAVVIWVARGQRRARRWPPRTIRPATAKILSRSRFRF